MFDGDENGPLKALKPTLQRASTSDDSELKILAKDGDDMLEPFKRADSQSTTTDEDLPESPSPVVIAKPPFKKSDSNNSLFSST